MFFFQVLNVLTWCLRIQGRRTASSKTIEISRVYWHNLRETSPREYHEMTFHRALWRLMLVCGFVEVAAGKPARVNPSTVPEVWIEHIWSYLNIVFGQSVIFSQEVTQKKDQQNGFWGILPKSPQHTTAAVEIRLVQILFMDKIRKTYGGGAVKLPQPLPDLWPKAPAVKKAAGEFGAGLMNSGCWNTIWWKKSQQPHKLRWCFFLKKTNVFFF